MVAQASCLIHQRKFKLVFPDKLKRSPLANPQSGIRGCTINRPTNSFTSCVLTCSKKLLNGSRFCSYMYKSKLAPGLVTLPLGRCSITLFRFGSILYPNKVSFYSTSGFWIDTPSRFLWVNALLQQGVSLFYLGSLDRYFITVSLDR